ncbi:hypothetical protein SELR_02980 [Selenomonas ruminantium subsp. lactilytica TAM6421]|uniref:Uncharacterized protein n=1 Tax=Selenomonas ruminantium subsp. lactilytica (strain NBRC 103574 / TAM6421) TaxID=927704 RepID=I0GML9_SELRL|nr:hypothetical protein [Selenomonas ruminantium]BAL82006.1 hypothetical protein SELR_02980 [Selenomonas ruminantium subsp. lactilytica TAM6421]
MSTLSLLLFLLFFPLLIAFIILWWKKRKARINAGDNYENNPQYIKISKTKRLVGILCIGSIILSFAIKPELTPEEKARYAAEQQIKAEQEAKQKAQQQAEQEAKEQAAKEQKMAERITNLPEDERNVFNAKFQEYQKNEPEPIAKEKALKDVDSFIKEKEDNVKKAKEEAALAEKKQVEEEKKRKELTSLEKAGKIRYNELGNGMVDVIITERATFKHDTNGIDNIVNYAVQDEHERNIISTSRQCMKLVQTVKDAGINVNNFTINLTGDTIDSAGYKSTGNVVICEIAGNKGFKRDDPYSFYNNTDRYWMINGL